MMHEMRILSMPDSIFGKDPVGSGLSTSGTKEFPGMKFLSHEGS